MFVYFITVFIAAVYSFINGFIANKDLLMTDRQLVLSGLVCIYGDIGALVGLALLLSGGSL